MNYVMKWSNIYVNPFDNYNCEITSADMIGRGEQEGLDCYKFSGYLCSKNSVFTQAIFSKCLCFCYLFQK